jgi:anti-anti-sigma regulatory factor
MGVDLAMLDVLARLQLAAKRRGCDLRVCDASEELCDLIELAGLSDVLRVESRGQAEEWEERLRVEEERELDDPAV